LTAASISSFSISGLYIGIISTSFTVVFCKKDHFKSLIAFSML
jgi:hypothetical protein